MIARLLVFRARLVGINFPSFLLFSPFKGSLILANAAKPPFLLVYWQNEAFRLAVLLGTGLRDLEI
jgi:hypothetical protein